MKNLVIILGLLLSGCVLGTQDPGVTYTKDRPYYEYHERYDYYIYAGEYYEECETYVYYEYDYEYEYICEEVWCDWGSGYEYAGTDCF
tara:strand:+ start:598 stop:861 length:264 start_codon:yes stop_codon:yes gene_type:complete